MALLTHSESLAFNGFLSSIDFGDSIEWSGINPDTIPLTPAQGKEALAKATKDLMSLEPNLHSSDAEVQAHRHSPVELNTSWPSFRGEQPQQPQGHGYTYGFNVPSSSRPSHRSSSRHAPGEQRRSPSQELFSGPRSRSPRSRDTSSSSRSAFGSSSDSQSQGQRPGSFSATSTPAVLNRSASSSKRSLPDGGSSGASAKRRRPSVVSQSTTGSPPLEDRPFASSIPRSTRASSVSSSTTATGTPRDEGAAKPALLSPSQKRANHIQSEQKRRANIRKGYEALCEVVPALRDAIRAEEEIARANDDKPKRKKKSKAEEAERQDGRAGPKSENIVLQKTIDHLKGLLAERSALSLRLNQARAALPNGHHALAYSPNHLDDKGVLLWEREWMGGTGWGDAEDDGGDDD